MSRFPGANGPLQHVVSRRDAGVGVYGERRLDAKLLLRGELVGGGIKGDAEDSDVEVLPVFAVFQINDLLEAGRSTYCHVEKEQHG